MKRIGLTAALICGLSACQKRESAPQLGAVALPAVAAPSANEAPPIAVGTKMKCPVTGEDFTVRPSTVQITYEGKRYAFCCEDCRPEFLKNPAKFAQK